MSSKASSSNQLSVHEQNRNEQIESLGEKGKTKLEDWRWLQIPQTSQKGPALELFDSLFPDIEDWALEDEWEPQTVADFESSERWKVSKMRRTIFIQPLAFDASHTAPGHPSLALLAQFTENYFGLPVKVLDPLDIVFKGPKSVFIGEFKVATSANEFGEKRLSVLSVMDYLYENLPSSAYCVLAITDMDIYEDAKDRNPIMGRGSGDRVGLLSLYRFNPLLSTKSTSSTSKKRSSAAKAPSSSIEASEVDSKTLLSKWLLPACKTLAHESMHMFGLDHCTHFLCVMNANVSPWDDGKDPIHLCPICLRKLHISCKFDLGDRLKKLLGFYHDLGWTSEAEFVTSRLRLSTLN